jgi:hypothetical protein
MFGRARPKLVLSESEGARRTGQTLIGRDRRARRKALVFLL